MHNLTQIFSLTLPLLIPGLVLILVLKLRLFRNMDIPLDLGLSLNEKRIFGDNKTFKGMIIMILVAICVCYILNLGYRSGYTFINSIFLLHPILLGSIYSFSYILGELINSYIKRQMNILSGKITSSRFRRLQLFFDLSDGIIVVVIALILFTPVPLGQIFIAGLVGIFLHYSTDVFMKRLSLK